MGFEADHYSGGMHLYAASMEPPETFEPTCVGDLYVHDCHLNQTRATDCAAVGGVCVPDAGCVMPLGAPCDADRANCAEDLTCIGADEYGTTWGTCG